MSPFVQCSYCHGKDLDCISCGGLGIIEYNDLTDFTKAAPRRDPRPVNWLSVTVWITVVGLSAFFVFELWKTFQMIRGRM